MKAAASRGASGSSAGEMAPPPPPPQPLRKRIDRLDPYEVTIGGALPDHRLAVLPPTPPGGVPVDEAAEALARIAVSQEEIGGIVSPLKFRKKVQAQDPLSTVKEEEPEPAPSADVRMDDTIKKEPEEPQPVSSSTYSYSSSSSSGDEEPETQVESEEVQAPTEGEPVAPQGDATIELPGDTPNWMEHMRQMWDRPGGPLGAAPSRRDGRALLGRGCVAGRQTVAVVACWRRPTGASRAVVAGRHA